MTGSEAETELLEDWRQLCAGLGLTGRQALGMGATLVQAYGRWPRRYHDTSHLLACVRHWRGCSASLDHPPAVALALWFHDAVYWPWAKDNEARSARWARRFILEAGLPATLADTVGHHVMATCHHAEPVQGDARWVVDIDLSILGQSPEVYDRFETGVRSEYRWVPRKAYVAGRSQVLKGFLERPQLYATTEFRERYEAPARHNLERALAALQA